MSHILYFIFALLLAFSPALTAETEVAMNSSLELLRARRIEIYQSMKADGLIKSPSDLKVIVNDPAKLEPRILELRNIDSRINEIRYEVKTANTPPVSQSERFGNRYNKLELEISELKQLRQNVEAKTGAKSESVELVRTYQKCALLQQAELKLMHEMIADKSFSSVQKINQAVQSGHTDSRIKALKEVRTAIETIKSNTTTSKAAKFGALKRNFTGGNKTGAKPASTAKPATTAKPAAKPASATSVSKPATSAKPATSVKPANTAKPATTAKPSTTVKPTPTIKPAANPTNAPSAGSSSTSGFFKPVTNYVSNQVQAIKITLGPDTSALKFTTQDLPSWTSAKFDSIKGWTSTQYNNAKNWTVTKVTNVKQAIGPDTSILKFTGKSNPAPSTTAKPAPDSQPAPTAKPTPTASANTTTVKPAATTATNNAGTANTAGNTSILTKNAPINPPSTTTAATGTPSSATSGSTAGSSASGAKGNLINNTLNDAIGKPAQDMAGQIKTNGTISEYYNSAKKAANGTVDRLLGGKGDEATGKTGYEVRRDGLVEALQTKISSIDQQIASLKASNGSAGKIAKLESLRNTLQEDVQKANTDKTPAGAKNYIQNGLRFAFISAATQGIMNIVDQVKKDGEVDLGKAFEFITTPQFVLGTSGAFVGGVLVQKGLTTALGKIAMATVSNMVPGFVKPIIQILPYTIGAMVGSDLMTGNLGKRSITQMLLSGAGSAIGMTLGAAIFPPVGAIAGSVLGGMTGDWLSKMLSGKDDVEVAVETLYTPRWVNFADSGAQQQDEADLMAGLSGDTYIDELPEKTATASKSVSGLSAEDIAVKREKAYLDYTNAIKSEGPDSEKAQTHYQLYLDLSDQLELLRESK